MILVLYVCFHYFGELAVGVVIAINEEPPLCMKFKETKSLTQNYVIQRPTDYLRKILNKVIPLDYLVFFTVKRTTTTSSFGAAVVGWLSSWLVWQDRPSSSPGLTTLI